ncbi:MAG: branched-chain amino acid transport system ATP-binding protein [Solirubrobacteraceae bacterium]|jgi:branched-chain amino acid transport system ATP-binding protein|nr:branched-chain amino acid transport system ATP-binding protein [Solirubrobacteraceae bacterium]
MPLLRITDLSSGYGNMPILHGVGLAVGENEIVALIGPNGAGKSTLMKTLFRLLPAWSGELVYDGQDLTALPPQRLAGLGMAYVPQEGNTFPELTVEENLQISVARVDRAGRRDAIDRMFDLFPGLADRRKSRARTLSGGERQMLAVASAIALRPRIVVLDEPTSGMAPKVVETLVERIVQVRESGTAVLWVIGESATQVLEHLDRAYVLQSGQITGEWGRDELMREDLLTSSFFGAAGEPVRGA